MTMESSFPPSPCPLCGHPEKFLRFEKNGKNFARCSACGLIFQDPPPSAQKSRCYYEREYYEDFGDQANRQITEARQAVYDEFFSRFRDFPRQTGRLLDLGSGYGDFLKKAQGAGWEAWGIEPSREASERSRSEFSLKVVTGTVAETEFPEGHFDVITLWNVIDCLPDLKGSMTKIRRWLVPGGVLFIRTPNARFHWRLFQVYRIFRPWLEKLGWKKEASVFLATNFNRQALERLLSLEGFSKIRIRSGHPTRGDAYQVFARAGWMTFAKSLLYGLAGAAGFLSGQRVLIGPNLIATAVKGGRRLPFGIRARLSLKKGMLHLFALIGYGLGFPLWSRLFGRHRRIPILLYHTVGNFAGSDLNVPGREFKKHLRFLKRKYSVIPLEEAVSHLESKKLPARPSVALTFDDGTRDNYDEVWPVLKEENCPATIFLLTKGEGPGRFLSHYPVTGPEGNRLLEWDQIGEMAGKGVSFGSHGESHRRLSLLSPREQEREIVDSKKKIESHLGRSVEFFSYPYGTSLDVTREVQDKVRAAGYRGAVLARFGTNGLRTDRWALRRIGIESCDTLFTLRAKLNGALGLLCLLDQPLIRRWIRGLDFLFLEKSLVAAETESPLLLASVDFPPHTDGVSTISREICGRLARRGREIMALGPKDRDGERFDRLQDYRIFRVPGYEWGFFRFFPMLFKMPALVFRHGVKKIFAMNIAYGGILSWLLSFVVPLEYLIFAYGYEFEKVKRNPFLRALYRSIYRRAKGIVTCSDQVKERLIQFGVSREKIETLYPAVDLDRFFPREIPQEFRKRYRLEGRRVLLTVGRLVERKGHDQVLRALPKVITSFPETLYCISGIGPYERRLREIVRELKLEEQVRFLGRLPEGDLPLFYNGSEMVLMPSREIKTGGHLEGFGIVFLEANACGKPVIGGKSGGVREAIRDGETGFLVDPEDSDEIAEKIIFLLTDHEERAQMGKRGLEWVRSNFDWERYVDGVVKLLCPQ